MSCVRLVPSLVLAALCISLQAQSSDGNVVTTPEQVRRVPPPAASATPEELELKGDELRGQRLFADAIDYYQAAIKKSPSAMLHNKLGIAHLLMIRHDEAKKCFERAVKLDPTLPEAQNNLGAAHYAKKNYGRAIKHYRKAIKLKDDSASFHSNLGTAFFARKDFEKAAVAYARAIELDPEVFERSSRSGVAVRHSTVEDRAQYSYVLAKMFALHGDVERTLRHLTKAMEDGFPVQKRAKNDKEFDGLRKDPRFVQLMNTQMVVINN
jgi:tetratricopeptide (TPR) repeat protein